MTVSEVSMQAETYDRVRYLGSIKINESLMDYNAQHREQIVAQAIHKLFNKTDLDLRPCVNPDIAEQPNELSNIKINEILGSVQVSNNLRTFYRVDISNNEISISIIQMNSNGDGKMTESVEQIVKHQINVISFASIDMAMYVSYVAKDSTPDSTRACHVIQCENSEQGSRMYNAFENAFKQNGTAPLQPFIVPDVFNSNKSSWDDTIRPLIKPEINGYYNTDPTKMPPLSGLVDLDSHYVNQCVITEFRRENEPVDHNANNTSTNSENLNPALNRTLPIPALVVPPTSPMYANSTANILEILVNDAKSLPYYHKSINRQRAGLILKRDGDFLIRESSVYLVEEIGLKNICLSVRNDVNGKTMIKHITLIKGSETDMISTKDTSFDTIKNLVDHYSNENRTLEMDGADGAEMGSIRIIRAILSGSSYV